MAFLLSLVLTITISISLVIGRSPNSSVSKDITERELNAIIAKRLEVMSEGERSVIFFNPQSMTQSRHSKLVESNKDLMVFGHFNYTGS